MGSLEPHDPDVGRKIVQPPAGICENHGCHSRRSNPHGTCNNSENHQDPCKHSMFAQLEEWELSQTGDDTVRKRDEKASPMETGNKILQHLLKGQMRTGPLSILLPMRIPRDVWISLDWILRWLLQTAASVDRLHLFWQYLHIRPKFPCEQGASPSSSQ